MSSMSTAITTILRRFTPSPSPLPYNMYRLKNANMFSKKCEKINNVYNRPEPRNTGKSLLFNSLFYLINKMSLQEQIFKEVEGGGGR